MGVQANSIRPMMRLSPISVQIVEYLLCVGVCVLEIKYINAITTRCVCSCRLVRFDRAKDISQTNN